MLYLATPSTEPVRDAMRSGLLGQMVTPNSGNRLERAVWWALDNGCFSDQWSEGRWLSVLHRRSDALHCLFAVVPDVVGDAEQTDELWSRYAGVVREYGYTPAYVTQNGCQSVPDDAGAVFTGGDDAWKLSKAARELIQQAKERGLWTHMGRVNTLRRLQVAVRDGYDSVDGTYLAWGPDTNLPRLLRYLRRATGQHVMFGGVV